MAGDDATILPTQRPLSDAELGIILNPLGGVLRHRWLSGGTFSAVQAADLADGSTVVIKTSVPMAALPDGRTPLLTYEHDMLATERDMLLLLEGVEGVPAPRVLLSDFTRQTADVDVVVMTMIPGTPWDRAMDMMSTAANDHAHESVGAIMAAMQTIKGDLFGYPAGDFILGAQTWPAFFTKLVEATVADADAWGVDIEADRLIDALAAAAHALAEVTVPTLVHNDLWEGNVLLDPATGEVHGIVDLERALFGDPLQDFCGAESMNTGPITPALLRGYEGAGGIVPWNPAPWNPAPGDPAPWEGRPSAAAEFDGAASTRLNLYRLWSMSVQLIEIVPRGFSGDWVAGHRSTIEANRAILFDRAGV